MNNDNQQQVTGEQLLTRRDVAERWQTCIRTIARTKDLIPIRFNSRRIRYRLADVIKVEQSKL